MKSYVVGPLETEAELQEARKQMREAIASYQANRDTEATMLGVAAEFGLGELLQNETRYAHHGTKHATLFVDGQKVIYMTTSMREQPLRGEDLKGNPINSNYLGGRGLETILGAADNFTIYSEPISTADFIGHPEIKRSESLPPKGYQVHFIVEFDLRREKLTTPVPIKFQSYQELDSINPN